MSHFLRIEACNFGNAGCAARADEYPGHFLMNMESKGKREFSYMDKANNLHDLGLKNTCHVDNLLTNSEYDYMELIETMRSIHKDYNS